MDTIIKDCIKGCWDINLENHTIPNEEESNWASSSGVIPTVESKGIQPPQ
jgi:hypothetical protein